MKKPATPKPDRTEALLAALIQPAIGMMRRAGISRMSIARDKSVVLQMVDGETLTIETTAEVAPPPLEVPRFHRLPGGTPSCQECLKFGPDYCSIHAV